MNQISKPKQYYDISLPIIHPDVNTKKPVVISLVIKNNKDKIDEIHKDLNRILKQYENCENIFNHSKKESFILNKLPSMVDSGIVTNVDCNDCRIDSPSKLKSFIQNNENTD